MEGETAFIAKLYTEYCPVDKRVEYFVKSLPTVGEEWRGISDFYTEQEKKATLTMGLGNGQERI